MIETIILPRWLRWSIYATTAVLLLTGLLWVGVRYGIREGGAEGLPHPAEPWLLRIHGFAMMAGLFVYGSLLRAHMINAWRLRKNRVLGTSVTSVLAFLALTGYMLYYVSGEETRPVISVAHWVVGLTIGGLLPLHVWNGRRTRNARN